MFEGTQVVVTGGTGFIGSRVTRLLADRGAAVRCPHRPGVPVCDDLPAEIVELDLEAGEAGAVDKVFAGADYVVHLAALSGGIQFQQGSQTELFWANQTITRNVLEACRRAGVRRAFLASSAVVYADDAPQPLTEDAPLAPPARASSYAWSKICDEVVARWLAADGVLEAVIGRFTNVYGPGGSFDPSRSTVVHALVRRAVEAGPDRRLAVWGDGSAVRTFLFVDDAARAVVTVLERGSSGDAYNLDAGEALRIAAAAETVRITVDPELRLAFEPARPQGVAERVPDGSKLAGLGFRAGVGFPEGVAHTVEHYRSVVAGRPQR